MYSKVYKVYRKRKIKKMMIAYFITIIIGQFLRNTREALGNLLFNIANGLTSRPLVFQMINCRTLNKKSFSFFQPSFDSLKLLSR